MFASSSFGPVDSSTCTAATAAAPAAPRSGTAAATTSGAPPPDASATKLFGRNAARCGPGPVKVVVTNTLPPKTGVVTATASPSTAMSTLLVRTVRSSLTESRAMTSRPSYVCGNMMSSGESPPSITAFIAADTATPGSLPPRVAGGVDLGGAVLAERRGHTRGVATDERGDRSAGTGCKGSGLGEQFERRRGRRPIRFLCEYPDVHGAPQMTFRFSRKATILA